MATDLGKVGIVMKGDWSSSATYEVLDAVSYDNGLYIAKQAVPANTLPTNTTYWQKALGLNYQHVQITGTIGNDWDANTTYEIGEIPAGWNPAKTIFHWYIFYYTNWYGLEISRTDFGISTYLKSNGKIYAQTLGTFRSDIKGSNFRLELIQYA